MSLGGAIWRRRLGVWLPALVFFLANLALFSTYRLVYAGRVESLRGSLEQREESLTELKRRSEELTRQVATARRSRLGVEALYRDRLSTESNRFTAVTAEIRELARRAGLEPAAMSYPTEEIEDYGLVKRYFTFNVEGTYVDLRRFINFLELTPSFVALEEVVLSGDQGARLAIRLKLSTFFVVAGRWAAPTADELIAPLGGTT
jgi:DNA-binding MarR family transcriptional regulator